MLGPVIALGDAVRASVSRHGNESALYRKMAVVHWNGCGVDIRQRIGELVATRVAEALGGDAGEQVAAAIAKAAVMNRQAGGRSAVAAGKPKWKRGGKGRATSGKGPRRSGSRAPSAAENTGDQDAATETPAPTEAAADGVNGSGRHGHRRRQGEPAAETDATGSNDAAGGDTREEAAGADGGTDAAAGTEGSEQAAE